MTDVSSQLQRKELVGRLVNRSGHHTYIYILTHPRYIRIAAAYFLLLQRKRRVKMTHDTYILKMWKTCGKLKLYFFPICLRTKKKKESHDTAAAWPYSRAYCVLLLHVLSTRRRLERPKTMVVFFFFFFVAIWWRSHER